MDLTLRQSAKLFHHANLNERLTASTSHERLLRNIDAFGLEIACQTPGDGSCFFHAVLHQMERLGQPLGYSSFDLRRHVVNYMKNYPVFKVMEPGSTVAMVDFREVHGQGWDNYLSEMRKPTVFADHQVIQAAAHFLGLDILIVTSSPTASTEDQLIIIPSHPNDAHKSILLLGHRFEDHFESLRVKDVSLVSQTCSRDPVITGLEVQSGLAIESLEEVPADIADEIEKKIAVATSIDQVPTKKEIAGFPHASLTADRSMQLIAFFERHKLKKKQEPKGITREIQVLQETEEDFIGRYLMEMNKSCGVFTYRHQNKGKNVQFFCERHSAPRGKKKGPTETIANSCNAYVSFTFMNHEKHQFAVIRRQSKHTNHDPENPLEAKRNPVDPLLRSYIECLFEQGKKPLEITVLAYGWAKSRGYDDCHDRRYFVTPQDVTQICDNVKNRKRIHKSDAVSVEVLCTDIIKENIVFYQPLTREDPLIIVYQNKNQLHRMGKYAGNLVFMDASYKGLTAYGYAVYCILVRDNRGRGTPASYFITSVNTTSILVKCLSILKDHAAKNGILFAPRSFMVDKDLKEVSAIKTVFPHSSVLLCWFHVLQAVNRWLTQRDSGMSGNNMAPVRMDVMEMMRHLKRASTREEFNEMFGRFQHQLGRYPRVHKYLCDNWLSCGQMWSNFGRKTCHESQETNNMVERFFLLLKLNYLRGYGNKRVDELLLLLNGDISHYHDYMEELELAGRLPKKVTTVGKSQAETMLLQGWDQRISWIDTWICKVQSHTQVDLSYIVDVQKLICECPASAREGMCKHVHVALSLGGSYFNTTVEEARADAARELYQAGSYMSEDSDIFVFDGDDISTVIEGTKCTCIAASHGALCICSLVAAHVTAQTQGCQPPVDTFTEYEEEEITIDPVAVGMQHNDEIKSFLMSEDNTKSSKQEICKMLKDVHCHLVRLQYKKTTLKHRIEPNSSSRATIDKAVKAKKQRLTAVQSPMSDHQFYTGNRRPKNKMPDGGFRRSKCSKTKKFT